ncbi:unnamed protein product (macronuclear) [Paramecium tetraurelia]|uniref:Chromosome undetermined scaffold_1, whole genome shotgun sequence n=1 Tax=Paramecium tetraurelia TaxID=5888 RepID=Q6BG51_PARTE|nr:hypothetical protein [Paramecium tetraurelia strain d4-2]XP_001423317.1 uncharacterized protein GSPATT00000354001 [Paramecium tetraurelia]CAH03369.1 hypothetical protein with a coiled-coil domain [Paramecium tetraurelia]CAK55919.1 unnamed protein product [Paramecium tetraurelia]|eukprot:XP_001423317.1 hypothetical protein (macronuclear) [Paramecium tetraurelia strain d4-2]
MSFQSISSSDLSNSDEMSFVKTDQERILKNSNILKHANNDSNNCLKHPNKKAKFYVQQNSNQLFCSKCALNLALQGLKIEETQEVQLEIQRKDKINNFQKDLHQALQQCDQKLVNMNDIKNNLINQWEEQNINCEEFFNIVLKTTNQLRQTYQQKLQNDYSTYQNQVQEQIENIKQLIQQLKQFSIDIFTNHDNIVKKMEMKPFDEIMQKYQKKVNEIRYQQINNQFQLSLKQVNVDQNQILTFMNKMCYNLLIKNDNMEYHQKTMTSQQNFESNLSNHQKYFDMFENEEVNSPMSTMNQVQLQSPIRQQFNKFESVNSNPVRSNANTPESWKQKLSLRRDNITPNDKISYQNSSRVLEQVSSKKALQKQLIDKYSYQCNEKQKTTTDCERISEKSYSLLNNNLSCFQIQKFIKEAERGSLEDRELTPKQKIIPASKSILQGQTYNNQIKNNSNQKSQQNLIQNYLHKQQYGSVPNLKSASHLQQQCDAVYLHRQQEGHLRSKSKQIKPQSTEQESKRQFIMNVGMNSNPQVQNEDTLKDKILKELCSHPSESVYGQVIRNHQQKSKNHKTTSKENYEWTSQKNRRIGQNINKKQ